MRADYKPLSLPMQLVLWLVVVNAYAGALSLVLSPSDTQDTFFWKIAPPINAASFGVLYLAAGSRCSTSCSAAGGSRRAASPPWSPPSPA